MAQDFRVPISTKECVGLFQGRERLDPFPSGTALLLAFAPAEESVVHCLVRVAAVDLTGSKSAAFLLSETFSKFSGVVTALGADKVSTHRTDPAWDVFLQASGGRIELRAITDSSLPTLWTWRLECVIAPIGEPALSAELSSLALPSF